MDLKFEFQKIIEDLIEPADSVVIGVSGGVDSVVLLDLLANSELALTLNVVHVNYGFRGKESDRDEKFVKKLAEKYSSRFFLARPKGLKSTADNVQSAARDLRYDLFIETAQRTGSSKILTAHHADDQAETILSHLMRGSGLSGLSGMQERRQISEGIELVRPLLNFSRKEILTYVASKKLIFVEDSTNKTTKYQRNAIRHELLPTLLKYDPSAVEHLCKMAALLRDEDDAIKHIAIDTADRICKQKRDEISFSRADLLSCHVAIRRRFLREAYSRLTGNTADLLADHIEKMLQISGSNSKKGSYSLPKGMKFERDGGTIYIKIYV